MLGSDEVRAVVRRPRGLAARKAFKAGIEGSAWTARRYIVGQIDCLWLQKYVQLVEDDPLEVKRYADVGRRESKRRVMYITNVILLGQCRDSESRK